MDSSALSTGHTICPNCGDAMERREFERRLGGPEALDLCYPCRSMWFDNGESVQLAPRAVIEIFTMIFKGGGECRRPLSGSLACPRCRAALVFTHDIGKTGRFTYFRCAKGDGRYTPFTEFLREKQFVRALAPAEMERVRAEIKQVRCSGCGANVDLARESACSHCGAPIAILDANAVESALREWSAQAEQRDEQRERLGALVSEAIPKLSNHCLGLRACPDQPAHAHDLIESGITGIGGLVDAMGFALSGAAPR